MTKYYGYLNYTLQANACDNSGEMEKALKCQLILCVEQGGYLLEGSQVVFVNGMLEKNKLVCKFCFGFFLSLNPVVWTMQTVLCVCCDDGVYANGIPPTSSI